MTKYEVTEQMVEAAKHAYFNPWPEPRPMRAAITAAIEASGLVEENARLREGLDNIQSFARSVRRQSAYVRNLRAIENFALEALNKEPTL
jgi:hypothetical protein